MNVLVPQCNSHSLAAVTVRVHSASYCVVRSLGDQDRCCSSPPPRSGLSTPRGVAGCRDPDFADESAPWLSELAHPPRVPRSKDLHTRPL
jgi:hypothetical protein